MKDSVTNIDNKLDITIKEVGELSIQLEKQCRDSYFLNKEEPLDKQNLSLLIEITQHALYRDRKKRE